MKVRVEMLLLEKLRLPEWNRWLPWKTTMYIIDICMYTYVNICNMHIQNMYNPFKMESRISSPTSLTKQIFLYGFFGFHALQRPPKVSENCASLCFGSSLFRMIHFGPAKHKKTLKIGVSRGEHPLYATYSYLMFFFVTALLQEGGRMTTMPAPFGGRRIWLIE